MVTAESSKNRRPLPITIEDGALSRLLSRDVTAVNSSSRRIYYGGSPAAVPFLWESRPGTPKHAFSDSSLPPLTPPPSYQVTTSNHKRSPASGCDSKATPFLHAIFPGLSRARRSGVRRLSSSSSSSTSSSSSRSSSSVSSPSVFGGCGSEKNIPFSRPRRCYGGYVGGASSGHVSPISTLCFGGGDVGGGAKCKSGDGGGGFRGRRYLANVKRALFLAVGHGSG